MSKTALLVLLAILSPLVARAQCVSSTSVAPEGGTVTLFYTRYNPDNPDEDGNVKAINITYGPFGFSFDRNKAMNIKGEGQGSYAGADGIVGNPQAPTQVLVGAQEAKTVLRIDTRTGELLQTTAPAGSGIYHLTVLTPNILLGAALPGALYYFNIFADGSLGNPQQVTISGDTAGDVTQIVRTPKGDYYTKSAAEGIPASFGKAVFAPDMSSVVLTQLSTAYSAHGAVWDPYSYCLFMYGANQIVQWDVMLDQPRATRNVPAAGARLDQGAVTGFGQLFIADNTNYQSLTGGPDGGYLWYLFYRNPEKSIATADIFQSMLGLELDDVAPLIGQGGTCQQGCNITSCAPGEYFNEAVCKCTLCDQSVCQVCNIQCGPLEMPDATCTGCVCLPPVATCTTPFEFNRATCGCVCNKTCPPSQELNRATCTCRPACSCVTTYSGECGTGLYSTVSTGSCACVVVNPGAGPCTQSLVCQP